MVAIAVDNDIHSGLNATRHECVVAPRDLAGLRAALTRARAERQEIAIAGGRHAMGGQQFVHGGMLLDLSRYTEIRGFDSRRGLLRVGAGTQWPAIHRFLRSQQADGEAWAIRQKQTGADDFSLGGSLAANVHGRGLDMAPLVADIESFRLLLADGTLMDVDRHRAPALFSAAIGGYGLFGVIESVTLRLTARRKLERLVHLAEVDQVEALFAEAVANGILYGDFQFAIDPEGEDFLHRGIFSRYGCLPEDADIPSPERALDAAAWQELMRLAHHDKRAAFEAYSNFYLSTAGQRYESDHMQMSVYPVGYHHRLGGCGAQAASEMITELFVAPGQLAGFMQQAADLLRQRRADVIYGTVRSARADHETMLPWARSDCLGIIFNLHVRHEAEALRHEAETFRQLIDLAMEHGGSYYLTYHDFARADQIRACNPRMDEWLAVKTRVDPESRFASNWYRKLVAKLAGNQK